MKKMIWFSLGIMMFAGVAQAEMIGALTNGSEKLGYIILDVGVLETLPILSKEGILPDEGQVECINDAVNEFGMHQAAAVSAVAIPMANLEVGKRLYGVSPAEGMEVVGRISGQGLLVRHVPDALGHISGGVYFIPEAGKAEMNISILQ